MAANEVYRDVLALPLPVPANTAPGSPVKVGDLVGVTDTRPADSANGIFGGGNVDGYATVVIRGAHTVTVNGAVTQVGASIYIDGNNALQVTASGNTLFGYALAIKSAAAAPISVLLPR